jgi:hypothetical protein
MVNIEEIGIFFFDLSLFFLLKCLKSIRLRIMSKDLDSVINSSKRVDFLVIFAMMVILFVRRKNREFKFEVSAVEFDID